MVQTGKHGIIAVRKLCFIDIARCRPQLTTGKPQKAQEAQNKGESILLLFCASCAVVLFG
jgi:hypothetical protein